MSYNRNYYGGKSGYRNYEFLEHLRGNVTMSGADIFSESEIKTPVGRATNQAMCIFSAEFEHSTLDAIAHGDMVMIQLAKNTKAAEIYLSNTDLISKMKKEAVLLTSGGMYQSVIDKVNFSRPILYAKSSIYVGMISVGMAAPLSGYVRLGYVLRFVHPNAMNRALIE